MLMDDAEEGTSAEEVQESQGQEAPAQGQAPASEAQASAASSWKLGDEVYEDPNELHKAAKRWMGEFTRSRQEFTKLRDESSAAREILDIIRSDPKLLAEVRARISAGQSPEQAVEQTAKNAQSSDPELVSMKREFDEWKQERAIDAFANEHGDVTDDEWEAMEEYITANAEWLDRSRLTYDRMLKIAYAEAVAPNKAGKLLEQGQKLKEDEIKKGQKKPSLGTQAPTARAQAQSKPYKDMTPAEKRDYAMNVYKSMAPGQR